MIAIAVLFVRLLCDCFKPRRRLEAEILVLRHQLNVLQQRAPRRLHLRWADRALFIWLYRRYPRILDAVTIDGPALQMLDRAGQSRDGVVRSREAGHGRWSGFDREPTTDQEIGTIERNANPSLWSGG
jgi:hypothetical protein